MTSTVKKSTPTKTSRCARIKSFHETACFRLGAGGIPWRLRMSESRSGKVARLEELRKRLDPFQLARTIERKLEGIYRLANRRLSPKEVQETATSSRRENVCAKGARSASLEIKKRFPLSHRHGDDGQSPVSVTSQMSRRSASGLPF